MKKQHSNRSNNLLKKANTNSKKIALISPMLVVAAIIVLFVLPGAITSFPSAAQSSTTSSTTTTYVTTTTTTTSSASAPPPALSTVAPNGDVNWPYYGNDLANTRFQNVNLINPSNINNLTIAWVYHTRRQSMTSISSFETSPIEINGTMYITDGQDVTYALNAVTGKLKWMYNPAQEMPPLSSVMVCCGQDNRGVAVGNGMVYLARLDDVIVGLNQHTGKQLWATTVANYKLNYAETMAPQFYNNEVIVGISGGDELTSGFVKALDANTGNVLWTFNTTVPATYDNSTQQLGGAPVWGNPTIDPSLGLVYVVTGNPGSDLNGEYRNGTNLYSDSLVALNIKTGQIAWYWQATHHDLWDWDWTQPATLFTSQGQPAIGGCSKEGQYWILNRETGKPIFPYTNVSTPPGPSWQNAYPYQPVSSVQSLTPIGVQNNTIPFPQDVPNVSRVPMFTPPSQTPAMYQPSADSGCEWVPQAYSPVTQDVYYPGRYFPEISLAYPGTTKGTTGNESGWGSGTQQAGTGVTPYAIYGAVNVNTGKIVWEHTYPNTLATSGSLVAGQVVFNGLDSGMFYAYNASNGAVLWSFNGAAAGEARMNIGGASGAPIAYVVNGQEYIAMAFGGNNLERTGHQIMSPLGDALVVFHLGNPAPNTKPACRLCVP